MNQWTDEAEAAPLPYVDDAAYWEEAARFQDRKRRLFAWSYQRKVAASRQAFDRACGRAAKAVLRWAVTGRNALFYAILAALAGYAGWINGTIVGFDKAVAELRADDSPILQQRLRLLDQRCAAPQKERLE